MDISPPPSDDYLAAITQLIAEKDRLVIEKDELVVSKDRLWREMHQIIQEKNERIEELFARCTTVNSHSHDSEVQALRDEVLSLARRNSELEEALRDALETDDEIGDLGSVEQNPDYLEQLLPLRTPTSPSSLHGDAEYITVASRPPTSILIRPIIKSDSYITHSYGKLGSLDPTLLNMIWKVFEVLAPNHKFVSASRQGSQNCIERRLRTHSASWTIEQSGCFACRTCFNRRQPCIRPIGNHEFLLLPLSVDVRSPDATWQDAAYYVYQYDGTTQKFPGVWKISK
jgi:hypothetical protein